ncbi:hypothetical protein HQQ94_03525 [Shewanella sp. VB17]|uniref:hypothetical protein n=1 Tax=Shewanella sp. VB17 TaxID=2739432 RepID=UPI0015664D43|nr:hypothetical protein [Shewanella sp. VB17]NRD72326.1 hypothetical protein [Shewanella sp. VB17]
MHQTLKNTVYLLLTISSFMVHTSERQQITFAFFNDPNSNLYAKWITLVYTDAFSQLDIDFAYSVMPALRASNMVDLGKVDGEPIRVANYATKHPNLVRIEEPLITANLSVFTYDPSIVIHSWKDLQNSQYNVEYYRGMSLAHQRLSQYIKPNRLSDSSSPAQSLRKLLRGRIDVYIDTDLLTKELLASPEFSNSHIQMVAKLEAFSSYGYLHQRHTELAIQLAGVLRQMKSENKLNAYFKQAKQSIKLQGTQP